MFTLFFLLILGVLLRAHQLDRALGGGDENQILLEWVYLPIEHIISTGGYKFMDFSTGVGADHIFHNIVLRIMVLLFGEENAIGIRFPAFIAGIACLWFIYKISRQIFQSKTVAQFALLAAAVCPIHIYYSQTARGYSFIMLFSTLSIYSTLKLLRSEKYIQYGLLLFFSGYLSVYTIPLSVVFVLGLSFWILLVLTVPTLRAEFNLQKESSIKKFYQFLLIFILMGIFSILSYWPHIDGMLQMLKEFYDNSQVNSTSWDNIIYSSFWNKVIYFIPNLFLKIFPGPLIYFGPFFFTGIIWGETQKRAYCFLPAVILLTTYLFTLVTGLSYFPRGYLFNLPLILVFFVGGVFCVADRLKKLSKPSILTKMASYFLMGTYVVLSLTELFLNHFPSTKTFDVNSYKKSIHSHTKGNDLLLVADPKHYLYARSFYQKYIKKIISENQLGGIKLLVDNSFNIGEYKVNTHVGSFPVFLEWEGKSHSSKVSTDRKLVHFNEGNWVPLLPKDFEAAAEWKIQSGEGNFYSTQNHKLSGKHSLFLRASSKQNMVLRGMVGEIELSQPQLVVLVWSTKKFSPTEKFYSPGLGIRSITNKNNEIRQAPLGKTNAGMILHLKEKYSNEEIYFWQVHSSIGSLPAGKTSLYLFLYCEKGTSIMYDSLRLFLIKNPPPQEELLR